MAWGRYNLGRLTRNRTPSNRSQDSMAERQPIVGGNWKMNLHRDEAASLARALTEKWSRAGTVEVVLFPAFPYLADIRDVLSTGSDAIKLGAQDCYHQTNGAYTGEVSLSMLRDVGVSVILAGHSERRHVIGETDVLINRKVRAALDAGFEVILCVGEMLEQRELGQTDAVNAAQTLYGLAGVPTEHLARVTIAYEPVWAIGTGKTATAADAQEAHAAIRETLAAAYSEAIAQQVRIQYGGSVKPANAAELFGQPDIDGGLIGGASLKDADFLGILEAAADTSAVGSAT